VVSVPAPQASPEVTDRYVVGVDCGTLSGRAVVMRVADGAALGLRDARVRPWRDGPRARRRLADRAVTSRRRLTWQS
jgi:ribulose kinase